MALAHRYRAQTVWKNIRYVLHLKFRFVLDRFASLMTTSVCVLQLRLRYREEANLMRNFLVCRTFREPWSLDLLYVCIATGNCARLSSALESLLRYISKSYILFYQLELFKTNSKASCSVSFCNLFIRSYSDAY